MMFCKLNKIYCKYAQVGGYCDSSACHNVEILGNSTSEVNYPCVNVTKEDIPLNLWQKGEPTEEGSYIVHFKRKDYEGEIVEYEEVCDFEWLKRYIELQDNADDRYFKVLAWMKYEPYKES